MLQLMPRSSKRAPLPLQVWRLAMKHQPLNSIPKAYKGGA